MAMGNYCYAQGIECPYATAYGQCQDDIYDDFGIWKCSVMKCHPKNYQRIAAVSGV